ncbi:MAG: exosortase/archaeosortase family protein [Nitrospirae bacterium]|nr:MAG: exosortase/archaeosortase family protein [Nitrospirota bacterium]
MRSHIEIIKSHPLTVFTYLAFAALFAPTFYKLYSYGWNNADYSHGPLILIAFFWLLWRDREKFTLSCEADINVLSLSFLLFGLFCYMVGSILSSMVLESFAMVPVLIGATGFLYGRQAVSSILFPALFLIFLVPPPGFFIDMVTFPLKLGVAVVSAYVLKAAGYLISRDGAIMYIGDYTIIVGDACSGMRSLVSLMAVGAVYAYLQTISNFKKVVLFLSVIPISIAANTIRLIVLALITYHYGEAAGQGFFHNFSGILLFLIAMGGLVCIDIFLNGKRAPHVERR